MLLTFLLVICTIQAQITTVYVTSNGYFHILDQNQMIGDNWKTDRSSSPGWFSASGPTSFIDPTDANAIDGYMQHIPTAANQNFTFPVGNETDLRTLTISGNIPSNALIGTAWIVGDPSSTSDPTSGSGNHPISAVSSPIISVSPAGQWDWVINEGDGGGVTVTVSMPDMSTFATTSDLRLVGWNGTAWIDLSGGPNATGNSENSTVTGIIPLGTTIQSIGIGSIATPLKAFFGNITAYISENVLFVNWTTLSEENTKSFIIQASADGKNFTDIGTTTSKSKNGSSNSELQYSYSLPFKSFAGIAGIGMLLLSSLLVGMRRKKVAFFGGILSIILFSMSCSKNNSELPESIKGGTKYVRIVSVDYDGVTTNSKVVKVVQQ